MKFSDLKMRLQQMTRQQANELADRADVPQSTVAKIRKGHTEQPRINTVEALSLALAKQDRKKIKAVHTEPSNA